MEHNEAIELKAAEKYVLRELPDDAREAYEKHFFDCAECATDIQTAARFAEASREIFAQEEEKSRAGAADPNKEHGWMRWLRPVVAVPVFAVALALVLVIGYESARPVAQPRQIAAVVGQISLANEIPGAIPLVGDERRGVAALRVVRVRRGDSFTLQFDFISLRKFDSYVGHLRDAAGKVVLPVSLSGDLANRTVNVTVPGGLVRPGKYTLAFQGVSRAPDPALADKRVESFTFMVEFI